MFKYFSLYFLFLLLDANVYAFTMERTEIQQNNVGNVEARLEADNVVNSIVQNNVAGNVFTANPSANIQGSSFMQENIGNVFSDLSVNNVSGQVIQRNIGGTVVVVN